MIPRLLLALLLVLFASCKEDEGGSKSTSPPEVTPCPADLLPAVSTTSPLDQLPLFYNLN